MRCDRFRLAASARLDGEPLGVAATSLDQHLATCTDCAGWLADATRLTRQARLSTLAVPDLTGLILRDVVLPTRRVLRRRTLLRAALLLVALVQLAIALPPLSDTGVAMPMAEHASHEAAAWNIAIAVAFLAAVVLPRRAAGLIPLLTTFIVVLGVLSVHDLAAGVVPVDRLFTHLAAVAGLLLLFAIDRAERALPPRRFTHDTSDGRSERALRDVA